MENEELIPIENSQLGIGNMLIGAKYKSTLVENQIAALAMTKVQKTILNGRECLIAKLYPAELKRALGKEDNIYRSLKNVAETMVGRTCLIENKDKFEIFALVTNATYERGGEFSVEFNRSLTPYLDKKAPFTELEISTLCSFNLNSSFRLYELMRREMYDSNRKMKNGEVIIEFNISELKFIIGLCDINHPEIVTLRKKMEPDIDYDVLYTKLPKECHKYDRWQRLKESIIEPAQKELLEKSDIKFEYEGIKKGQKTNRIRFYIRKNKQKETIEMAQDIDLYNDYIDFHGITKDDIDNFIKIANGDKQIVKDAISYVAAKAAEGEVNNFTGYIISTIQNPQWIENEGFAVVDGHDIPREHKQIGRDYTTDRDINENKINNRATVWENAIKTREDFVKFLEFLKNVEGWNLETFEIMYNADERIEYWKKWHDAYM